jgi:hypothetical protein
MYKLKSSQIRFFILFIFSFSFSGLNAQNQEKYLSIQEIEDVYKKNERNHVDRNSGLGLVYEIALGEITESLVTDLKSIQEIEDIKVDTGKNSLKIYLKIHNESIVENALHNVIVTNKLEKFEINKFTFIY